MKKLALTLVAISIMALPAAASAGTASSTVVRTTGSWLVPAGITSAIVDVYGAGGGGAPTRSSTWGGGGGGSGAMASSTVSLTPGDSIAISIGDPGSCNPAGTPGGDSYWVDASTIMAKGGTGGDFAGSGGPPGAGGVGGLASASVGTTKVNGNTGASGSGASSGSGGAALSSTYGTGGGPAGGCPSSSGAESGAVVISYTIPDPPAQNATTSPEEVFAVSFLSFTAFLVFIGSIMLSLWIFRQLA